MADFQEVIAKIMLEGVLKDAIFKTYGKACYLNDGTTVEAAIANILTSIDALPTSSDVDSKIAAESKALYNKIMGLTDEETTINEAFDTLKEVAAWIGEHGDVAAAFTNDIAGLKTAVQGLQTALDGKVDKADGMGLSHNDFTDNEKSKLASIAEGANKYVHPDTHSADMITETEEKQFISAADKAELKGRPVVYVGETAPANMKNGDILLQIITE